MFGRRIEFQGALKLFEGLGAAANLQERAQIDPAEPIGDRRVVGIATTMAGIVSRPWAGILRGVRCAVNNLLSSRREAIGKLCARYGVSHLAAFGSALRDDFKPGESDVDLLVEFVPMAPYARVDAYFGLRDELQVLLGQEIDLVMAGAVKNPYVARDIERTKQLLYAA